MLEKDKRDIQRTTELAIKLAEWFKDNEINPMDAHFAMIRIQAAMLLKNAAAGADLGEGITLSIELFKAEVALMLEMVANKEG